MTARELLLTRQGLVFLPPAAPAAPALPSDLIYAVELQMAELGYVLSHRLRRHLACLSLPELTRAQDFLFRTLSVALGADRTHTPLFRKFPAGVPADTLDLYIRKVLVHFFQGAGQPCLFCRQVGTTHVLSCLHVVCDQCFDGASYSACPACEQHVDTRSPFFRTAPAQSATERVTFKLLDLGDDLDREARALLVALCQRRQVLSPSDRDGLLVLVREYQDQILPWLPAEIPVKENVATVFGTLLKVCPPAAVLPAARARLATATDILRLIAVYSGADPALQAEARLLSITQLDKRRWAGRAAKLIETALAQRRRRGPVSISIKVRRFKVARMARPLRRAMLELLEGLVPERRIEDMLRHRSLWLWVGEFLHPYEGANARRFPGVALAFAVLRGTPVPGPGAAPADALGRALQGARAGLRDGLETRAGGALAFRNFYARLEAAATQGDAARFLGLLGERPGELARRLDHALRLALAGGQASDSADPIIVAFIARLSLVQTPVLLTLFAGLPRRHQPAARRLYWPKGQVARGVSAPDQRPPLPPHVTAPLRDAITAELLRRFAARPAFAEGLVDGALRDIIVPFNERTASRSAVALPRGSRLAIPDGKLLRLFLHWCEPEGKGGATDIDLSVGFYDDAWGYVGVCSYYGLRFTGKGGAEIAVSSGDLRDAPFPDGASEFVDLHRERARAEGIRYAVMVVTNYAGLPFSALERGFAGLMLRDDAGGGHFDPRLVHLKFALQGDNGVYLPMVVDLRDGVLHWVDAYKQGQFAMNSVATANGAIQKLCPEMIEYFASGARASLYDLALLHAAARCQRVALRDPAGGDRWLRHERRPGESAADFYRRLADGAADAQPAGLPQPAGPVFAALLRGDLALPEGSTVYALFREQLTQVIAASDLLS